MTAKTEPESWVLDLTGCPTCISAAAKRIADLVSTYPAKLHEALTAGLQEFMKPWVSSDKHDPRCPHWTEWRDVKSFVYFIRSGARGPIKIGSSRDPVSRLRRLQTAHHSPLTLLGTMRGGEPVELSLHEYLANYRLIGEWFHPSDDVLSVVNALIVAGEEEKRYEQENRSSQAAE